MLNDIKPEAIAVTPLAQSKVLPLAFSAASPAAKNACSALSKEVAVRCVAYPALICSLIYSVNFCLNLSIFSGPSIPNAAANLSTEP
jgi:hypothetical protein